MMLSTGKKLIYLSAFLVAVLGVANFTSAQEKDPEANKPSVTNELYMISANAGAISYVSGKVLIARKNYLGNDSVKKDYALKDGEIIRTEATGKAEILLNPGSYLRLGQNSQFSFEDISLDNLRIKLDKGSAIFEIAASKSMRKEGFYVEVATPNTKLFLNQSGIYRLNILPNNATEILVWRGEVKVGSLQAKAIDARKRIVVSGTNQTLASLGKDEFDGLDTWSNERAASVARLNNRLRSKDLANSIFGYANTGGTGSGMGFWVLDRATGRWFFLPFRSYWNSPYGYNYDFWYPWHNYYGNGGVTAPTDPQAKGNLNRELRPPIRVPSVDSGNNEGARVPPVRQNDTRSFGNSPTDRSDSYDSSTGSRSSSSSSAPAPAPAPAPDPTRARDQ